MNTKNSSELSAVRREGRTFAICSLIFIAMVLAVLSAHGQSYIRIKNVATGYYLYESGGKVVYGIPSCFDQTAQWIMASDGAGHYRFQNRSSGHYMNIENQLSWIECNAGALGWSSEKWNWVLATNNQYRIQSIWKPTCYANLDGNPGYVQCSNVSSDGYSQFTIETVEGATPPFTEYEAENGSYNGTLLGPYMIQGNGTTNMPTEIATEASNRMCVQLVPSGTPQYVQWVTQAAANALVVRLAVPDSSGGGGANYTLDLYVNGSFVEAIPVTSEFSWIYGTSVSSPSENPADGTPHHFFDEVQVLLPSTYAAGSTVKLQVDSTNTASFYDIDLIDLENVSPLSPPTPPYISITDPLYGANPTNADNEPAIQHALNDGHTSNEVVWIPTGTYTMKSNASVTGTTVQGAGMWYSVLTAPPLTNAAGLTVHTGATVNDLQIVGNGGNRTIAKQGIVGWTGSSNITINDVWLEHCGSSMPFGGTYNNVTVSNCRVRDAASNGPWFNGTVSNGLMTNCTVRNTGDDSLTVQCATNTTATNNIIANCTVQSPYIAACYAVYGGQGTTIENSEGYDSVEHCGVYIANAFGTASFGPLPTVVTNVDLYRCGGNDFGAVHTSGAVVVSSFQGSFGTNTVPPPDLIDIDNTAIYDPSHAGIEIAGTNSGSAQRFQNGVTISNVDVENAGQYGLDAGTNWPAYGIKVDPNFLTNSSGNYTNVTVYNPLTAGSTNASSPNYTFIRSGTNVGW
jgi:hypothetical protein